MRRKTQSRVASLGIKAAERLRACVAFVAADTDPHNRGIALSHFGGLLKDPRCVFSAKLTYRVENPVRGDAEVLLSSQAGPLHPLEERLHVAAAPGGKDTPGGKHPC